MGTNKKNKRKKIAKEKRIAAQISASTEASKEEEDAFIKFDRLLKERDAAMRNVNLKNSELWEAEKQLEAIRQKITEVLPEIHKTEKLYRVIEELRQIERHHSVKKEAKDTPQA